MNNILENFLDYEEIEERRVGNTCAKLLHDTVRNRYLAVSIDIDGIVAYNFDTDFHNVNKTFSNSHCERLSHE